MISKQMYEHYREEQIGLYPKDFAEVGKERESLYNLMSLIKNRDCGFLELQV